MAVLVTILRKYLVAVEMSVLNMWVDRIRPIRPIKEESTPPLPSSYIDTTIETGPPSIFFWLAELNVMHSAHHH